MTFPLIFVFLCVCVPLFDFLMGLLLYNKERDTSVMLLAGVDRVFNFTSSEAKRAGSLPSFP